MAKKVYFPWDKIPDKVYHADLTGYEHQLLEDCAKTIVGNIFRREKNPAKRAALTGRISKVADSKVSNITAMEEVKWKVRHLVKKTKSKKKKNKKK